MRKAKRSQRSIIQTERMKNPENRAQISKTMTGRKYDTPRRTRAILCSRGIIHETTLAAAEYYGVHPESIRKALNGKRKTNEVSTKEYGAIAFSYADET